MTIDSTEALLRDALQARAGDTGTGGGPDPWLRISRAHRRSQLRRRTVTVGALAALAVVTGSLAGARPWADHLRHTQPADTISGSDLGWLRLDDGTPRGTLGSDPSLRRAVVEALQKEGSGNPDGPQLARPDTVHLLWGGELEGKRVALARAVQVFDPRNGPRNVEVLAWMIGPVKGGAMSRLSLQTEGPAIQALPYLDAQGRRRLLAVVGRDAQVAATRTTISADGGELERTWSSVPIQDGVVDVPVPDPAGRGPLLLQTWFATGGPGGGFASSANPFSPSTDSGPANGLTPALRDQLAEQARGPGLPSYLSIAALDSAISQFWSDAAHTAPRVEWSGTVPQQRGGGSLVVASAGFPGQGRALVIQRSSKNQGNLWRYVGTVPADAPFGAGSAYTWRIAPAGGADLDDPGTLNPDQHVVVWMVATDTTSVSVTVNGKARRTTTEDGLGWLVVDRGDEVVVTGHSGGGHSSVVELPPKSVEPAGTDWPLLGTG